MGSRSSCPRAPSSCPAPGGRETALARWLGEDLRRRGWQVLEQRVDEARFNLLATLDPPDVVFSTHLDCVPPFFGSRQQGDLVFGPGGCAAHGRVATQIVAGDRLRRRAGRRGR